MPPLAHAVLSASGAHRWLECPGSIRLSRNIPRTTSVYAEEGTAAHRLAEWCLTQGCDASAKIGKTVLKSKVTGDWIVVTKEMAEAVQVYLDTARSIEKSLPSARTVVEKKFKLDWLLDGQLWGTNDANIFQPYGKMVVLDYKHGQGVAVSSEENVQLMYYALGALGGDNPHCVEDVEIIIIQPRAPGEAVKRWSTTPEVLYKWAKEVLLPGAKLALTDNAPLHAGDQCKFCPALATCPQVAKQALQSAQIAFTESTTKADITLPPPALLDTARLEEIHEVAGIVSDWAAAVASELKQRLERGEPGQLFKIVAGRATRKWIDEVVALDTLKTIVDPYSEPALLSVAQMEKRLKDANVDPKVALNGLVTETRGQALATINDKRPALTGVTPFTPVIDGCVDILN
ncbi:MAG: DUF2800 domain-containing protein [Verrucomicrobiota bacterium]